MKKKVLLMFLIVVMIISNMAIASNNTRVEVEDIFTVEIPFDEKILTADFSVFYDEDIISYEGIEEGKIESNYIEKNNERIFCYYDVNNLGTNTLKLKFKAKKEKNNMSIVVNNLTAHSESKELNSGISMEYTIDINKKSETPEVNNTTTNSTVNNIVTNNTTTNSTVNNAVTNNTTTNNTGSNTVINNTSTNNSATTSGNQENNNNINVTPDKIINDNKPTKLPNTGSNNYIILIIIAVILVIMLIKFLSIKKIDKKYKLLSIVSVIGITTLIYGVTIKATVQDKIFINTKSKDILIVISTENKNRGMQKEYFASKSKAEKVYFNNQELKDQDFIQNKSKAQFYGICDYDIEVYRDENSDGLVNSSDIFEMIKSSKYNEEQLNEVSQFIIKTKEFTYLNENKENYEEFNEDSIEKPDLEYTSVENVETLKKQNANVGDKYKTLGYYSASDKGAGKYIIVEKEENVNIDNGLHIELDNGKVANLIIEEETVNIKQFGAKNDNTDNSEIITKALNSGVKNIVIPAGEYKINKSIKLQKEGINVIGNDSVIFTDNEYEDNKNDKYVFEILANDCNLSGISIEAKETEIKTNSYTAQLGINAKNIKVKECTFYIKENVKNENEYINICIEKDWANVQIKDCNLYNQNDSKTGSNLLVKTANKTTADELTFENNNCYQKTGNKILDIQGTITNVKILNNTLVGNFGEELPVTSLGIGNDTSNLENVTIEGNNITCSSKSYLLLVKKTKNIFVKENKITYDKISESKDNRVFYFANENGENNVVENNEITINNESSYKIMNAFMGKNQNLLIKGNNILVNGIVYEFFNAGYKIVDNTITFNKDLHVLSNIPNEFIGNHIIVNEDMDAFFQFLSGTKLNWESNIKNNIFENNYNEYAIKQTSSILMFNGGTLNDYSVNFEGNKVLGENVNLDFSYIYTLKLGDTTPQKINIKYNNIDGYEKFRDNGNNAEHIVTMYQNTINGFNEDKELLVSDKVDMNSMDRLNTTGISYWTPIPMVSQELLDMGISGGEGCQWPISMTIDNNDGNLILYGTDCGGIYRSTDGGKSWGQSNEGWGARGASAFAIDPNNENYVIGIGANTLSDPSNGIYLSENGGKNWNKILSLNVLGKRDIRDSVYYDATSYSKEKNRTLIAYYSTAYETEPNTKLEEDKKGLYKTEDGGETWTLINNDLTDGIVKVNPVNGDVYVGTPKGLYYSSNKGQTFTKKIDNKICGLDIVKQSDEVANIYILETDKMVVSKDNGKTFENIESSTFIKSGEYPITALKVSPVNPNNMVYNAQTKQWNHERVYSTDGGRTWNKGTLHTEKSMMHSGTHQNMYVWSPSNANKVWGFGGDFATSSSNAGQDWEWDSNGITGILCGGQFNFNVYNPDIMYFGSQDYNGCVTIDGGKTWKYVNMSGLPWGGFCYGGYAVDEQTYYVGVADGWYDTRRLKITFDGGKTVVDTGLDFDTHKIIPSGSESSLQSPTNPDVLFACDLRSTDRGKTWERMTDCINVMTYNREGKKELYGIDPTGLYAVVSYDNGETWTKLNRYPVPEPILSMDFDSKNEILYATYNRSHLIKINKRGYISVILNTYSKPNAPLNSNNYINTIKVAVDYQNPNVIYCGGPGNTYLNDCGIYRSADGGKTWQVVTSNGTNSIIKDGPASGYEPVALKVHPVTGEMWCAGGCFGFSKLTPPYKFK